MLIAKLDNPEIDVDYYENRVAQMVGEIREDLKRGATDVERREALDRYLFQENGFHGNRSEYYHPANSHMNRVIDDREGIPITLSILYMELARQLELKIVGVGLPGHFVVRHDIDGEAGELIDVYEEGESLSDDDAASVVKRRSGRQITDHDLRAQNDEEILTRVLTNLMGIATGGEDWESMLKYLDAMVAINPEAVDFRLMRAQARGMTKRNSLAIEDIDWIVQKNPKGIDYRRLEQMRRALE